MRGNGGAGGGSVPSVPHHQTFASGKDVSKNACYSDKVGNDGGEFCGLYSSRKQGAALVNRFCNHGLTNIRCTAMRFRHSLQLHRIELQPAVVPALLEHNPLGSYTPRDCG